MNAMSRCPLRHIPTELRAGSSITNCPRKGRRVSAALLTFVASGKTERRDRTNDTKDIVRQNGVHFSLSGVGLEESKTWSGSRDNLLFFRPRKLPQQRL